MTSRFFSVACMLAAAWLAASSGTAAAQAQAYPSKPVRIIVPYAAAGATHITARILADRLSERFQQRVLVENRSGAQGVIGIDLVAKAPPDGYTLLAAANAFSVLPSLIKSATYDPVRDFAAVSLISEMPLIVVVNNAVPAHSVAELIALLKANPNKYNYASSGTGGPQHLTAELFKAATGTQFTHVPYRGAAPAGMAILAGETQVSFGVPTITYPYVKAGKLRALAATTATRTEFAPELPTLAESGLPGFHYTAWVGLLAPAATPKEIVARIQQESARVAGEKSVREAFLAQSMASVFSTPEDFATYLRNDVAKSVKIIHDLGIKPE